MRPQSTEPDSGVTTDDLQILDEASGALHSLKTPTMADDPSIGLMTGIVEAATRFGRRRIRGAVAISSGSSFAVNRYHFRRVPADLAAAS
jgi:N-methylhydantoinase A